MGRSPDVVVIGSGVIGCSVAWELARRGASVHVVDDRPVGMGATQASAGVLAPYIEADEKQPAFLDLSIRSLSLYDEFITDASADSRTDIPYRHVGTLQTAMSEDRLAGLRWTAARLAERGVAASLLDAQAVRTEEPQLADDVLGGLVIGEHRFVQPFEMTIALAAAAKARGARFGEPAHVRRVSATASGASVETTRGSLAAQTVVMAAGSWSGRIEIAAVRARPPVKPVRGQLLHLAWNGPILRRVTWGERCYLVPWADGTLLVGATVEDAGFDERTTVAGVRDLLEAVSELVPHAWTAGFLGARAGLRPGTSDDLPIVGWSKAVPNLMYATGHYRNGILLAPLTSRVVADAVIDGRNDPSLQFIGPARFGEL